MRKFQATNRKTMILKRKLAVLYRGIFQELCESRGGRPGQTPNSGLRHTSFNRQVPESGVWSVRPGLSVLTSLLVSVDVKLY